MSAQAADLDGDGDLDALVASIGDDNVAWYANLDGHGHFGGQQLITAETDGPWSAVAADLDGDQDLDILVASYWDNMVSWYENTDGRGSYGTQRVITRDAQGAHSVCAEDLDGDGDLDVAVASYLDDKISWFANTDGTGSFGAEQVITAETNGPWSVIAADVNGDGFIDLLSASNEDGKIAWYMNTNGQGDFGPQQVIKQLGGAIAVEAADLDGDGDTDVLAAAYDSDAVVWFPNTDGQGQFGAQQVVANRVDGALSVDAADMDGDGDLDVIAAAYGGDRTTWYPNDGQGNYGPEKPIAATALAPPQCKRRIWMAMVT